MSVLNMRHPTRRRVTSRARDLVLYIVISLAIAIVIISVARTGMNGDALFRWIDFGAFTSLIFGYFVYGSRPLFKKWSFWVMTAVALVAHMAIFISLIMQIPEWKLLWNSVMFAEIPVLVFFRKRICHN